MNVKILLFPLALVLIVYLAIWQIAPSYTLMNQQRDLLNKDNQKLTEAQAKNSKADKLSADFNSATEDRDVIFKYLPEQKKEDEIINTIDTVAFSENIALYSFSIADVAKSANPDLPGVIPGTSYLPGVVPPQAMQGDNGAPEVPPMAVEIYPTVNEANVKLDFVTNYDKLKSFLAKLSNLKRFNKITSLQIGKAKTTGENADPNALQVDLGLTFNYLLVSSSKAILSEATFQVKDFDQEAINSIKNKLNTDIAPVNIGQKGKTNPFLP